MRLVDPHGPMGNYFARTYSLLSKYFSGLPIDGIEEGMVANASNYSRSLWNSSHVERGDLWVHHPPLPRWSWMGSTACVTTTRRLEPEHWGSTRLYGSYAQPLLFRVCLHGFGTADCFRPRLVALRSPFPSIAILPRSPIDIFARDLDTTSCTPRPSSSREVSRRSVTGQGRKLSLELSELAAAHNRPSTPSRAALACASLFQHEGASHATKRTGR